MRRAYFDMVITADYRARERARETPSERTPHINKPIHNIPQFTTSDLDPKPNAIEAIYYK